LHDDHVKNLAEESLRKAAFARGSCSRELWFKRKSIRSRPAVVPAAVAGRMDAG